MLTGTIINFRGKPVFDYRSTSYNTPEEIRHVWTIETWRTSGYSYCSLDEAYGKPATLTDGRVHCYLGNGDSADGTLLGGGSAEAVIVECKPVPPPKTRVETRWHNGRWEKYLSAKGWTAA